MRTITIVLFCFLSVLEATAQTAVNDATFNPGDVGFGIGSGFYEPYTGTNGRGNCMIAQSDNKILIGGSWDASDAWLVKKLVRLNTDGSIDFTFNTGTGFNGDVYCVMQQPDGKIVVGGAFTSYSGTACNYICRLNLNGTIDATFSAVPGCDGAVRDVLYVSGNKLVIGGDFTSANAAARNKIARLNLNGVNDATFNVGGSGVVGQVRCMALQTDGKIVVGGLIASYNGTTRNNLFRVNTDGSLDGTYLATAGAGPNDQVNDVEVQGSNHIVAGNFTSVSGVAKNRIARLFSNGFVDGLFEESLYSYDAGYDVLVLQDGSTWASMHGGSWPQWGHHSLLGHELNGQLYSALTEATMTAIEEAWNYFSSTGLSHRACQQSDGKIVVLFECMGQNIARFNADGTYDPTFFSASGLGGSGTQNIGGPPSIESGLGDGLWIGNIAHDNAGPAFFLSSRLSNGQLDPDFDQNAEFRGDYFAALKARSNGSVTLCDSYASYWVYSPMGLQTALGYPTGADYVIAGRNGIAHYADGKTLIGGSRTGPPGADFVQRFTVANVLDPSFSSTEGTGAINAVALTPDGLIYLGGSFTELNAITRNRIARLLPNGTLDPAFNPLAGFNGNVNDIALQPDGKILCTGEFTTYRGTSVPHICRLNTDASLDATFNVGTGLNGIGHKILLRADGLVFVGGQFTLYNGAIRGSLVAINGDGSVNTAFDTGVGFRDNLNNPGLVSDFVIQSTGQIVAVGEFTKYQSVGRNRIARIGTPGVSRLALRVMLDGPWNGTNMNDGLRLNGLVPLKEPYAELNYPHMGGGNEMTSPSVLNQQGGNAIVDWVVVELRDVNDATVIVRTRSALLQRDGDVVETDGTSPLSFFGTSGNTFISVHHRNHLGVMAGSFFNLTATTTFIDLSTINTTTYGTDARRNNNGTMTLWSGDVKGDAILKYTGLNNDRDPILVSVGGNTPNATTTGYKPEDLNLDGVVKYTGANNDRDPILVNVGSTTPNNTRLAQLP